MAEWLHLSWVEFLAILAMCAATYSSRLLGWFLLKDRSMSPRARALLDAAPGCVMVAIAAPFFFTTNPVHLIALLVAIVVSRKAGMASTVLAAVGTAAVLGQVL